MWQAQDQWAVVGALTRTGVCDRSLKQTLSRSSRSRQVVTTTPRPIPLLRRLLAEAGTIVSRARTADNAGNLAAGFLERVVARYAGTALGRQELDGELIEQRSDALWQRGDIETPQVTDPPWLRGIVVAVDPPGSHRASDPRSRANTTRQTESSRLDDGRRCGCLR